MSQNTSSDAYSKFDSFKDSIAVCKQSFVSVGVFSGVINILMLTPAFFMLNVYDKAIGHNSLSTLAMLSLITVAMFVVLGVVEAIRARVLVAISSRLDKAMAPRLYEICFANAVNVGSGRATTQPLQDLNGIRQYLTNNGVFAFFDAPWLPIYLLVLFLFHPLLGWMGVVAAVVFFAVAVVNQRQTGPSLEEANNFAYESNLETTKNLRNAEVVASMGMLDALQSRWRVKQDEMLVAQETASNAAGLYNSISKTLRIMVQSAAIATGAYLALKQEISPGMIIGGSILIGRALQPVELAVSAWKGFLDAKEQYGRLEGLLSAFPREGAKMALPDITGKVSARSATISPPGSNHQAVRNVSFDIPSGSVCMVLGPSGAGKSTLMRGVLGLWRTTSGEIRIDGAEAASYDRVQLGPQIGYLPQSIELLDGTVSSNIARFGEVCSDSVVLAARDAGVHNFILSLPSGYDTVIGMGGGILSPGQRQRVALARALYKRPKLVVLDEPNSNLDTDGEQALNESIKILKEVGSTVVVVSHRQTVLPLVDHAIVMNDGVVADAGPIREVTDRLAQKYADLYPSDVGTQSRKKIRTLPTVVPVTPLPAPTHQD